jgi:YD repeat-containing protein
MLKRFLLPALVIMVIGLTATAEVKTRRPHHTTMLVGTTVSVDKTGKLVTVKESSGKETTLAWSDATKVTGGTLQEGEKVTVRCMEKDGKTLATAIQIHGSSQSAPKKKS